MASIAPIDNLIVIRCHMVMADPIDSMRISATYVRRVAREHAQPQTVLDQFALADVTPRDTTTVPLALFFDLLRAVDRSREDRDWHLKFARRTADHFHGPLTFALMSAPTIGAGLEAFVRFVAIRGAYLHGSIRRAGLRHFIGLAEIVDLGDLRYVLVEIAFRILHEYIAIIGDVNPAAATLYLAYPAEPERNYYARGFDCRVVLDAREHELAIPSAWTAIPNPQYDERMWASALAQCGDALAALRPRDTLTRTRNYVTTILEHDPKSLCLEHAAGELNLSVRTLIRQLRARGTTFQALRDAARQELALRLLAKPNQTVDDVARAVGFSDAANFSRAFKRWFGVTPGRYRRALPG